MSQHDRVSSVIRNRELVKRNQTRCSRVVRNLMLGASTSRDPPGAVEGAKHSFPRSARPLRALAPSCGSLSHAARKFSCCQAPVRIPTTFPSG